MNNRLGTLTALMLALAGQAFAAPFSYISRSTSNDVIVVDVATNVTVATIAVGYFPLAPAVNGAGTRVYVPNAFDNSVSVIDTASNTVIATAATGSLPYTIEVHPAGHRAYVTNYSGGTVSVLDTNTNSVFASVAVGGVPGGIDLTPDGTKAYVCAATPVDPASVAVIDTDSNTVITQIPVPSCNGLRMNPSGTEVYVPSYRATSSGLTIIDTSTDSVSATISFAGGPHNALFNPSGSIAYLSLYDGDAVLVFDTSTQTILNSIATGQEPAAMAMTPDGSILHVVNAASNSVSVINTASNSVSATLPVAGTSFGFSEFMVPVSLVEPPFDPLIAIAALRSSIGDLGLTDTRLRNSLLAPLNSAYNWLSGSDPNRVTNACSQLAKFVSVVGQNYNYGKLTNAVASALVLEANAIRVELGCRNPNSGTIQQPT